MEIDINPPNFYGHTTTSPSYHPRPAAPLSSKRWSAWTRSETSKARKYCSCSRAAKLEA